MNDFTKYTGRPGASRRGHWPIALLGLSLVSLLAVLLERTAAQQCPDFPEVGGNSRALAWDDGLQRRSWGVSTTEDGLTIYFDTHEPTTDLFRARRERIDEPFGAPEMLPPPVSGPDWEWFPRISPDGRWLYFAALRLGTIEIYASRAPFDQVIRLDQQVNRGVFSWPGCVTYDNTEFFFLTGWDLAVADFNDPGNPEAGFGNFRELDALNVLGHQSFPPSISRDGTMLFFSDRVEETFQFAPPRPGGTGGSDLWVALRCTAGEGFGPWQSPSNLGALNTGGQENSPWISADGTTLLYSINYVFHEVPLEAALPAQDSPVFRRGDPDDSGAGNITDAVGVLDYLFAGGEPPKCLDAADIDNDGALTITDPVSHLNFLFGGGAPPESPGPDVCGPDPHAAGVPGNPGCAEYTSC